MNKFKFFLIFLGILVVLNLAVLDWWIFRPESGGQEWLSVSPPPPAKDGLCSEECQGIIKQIVEEKLSKITPGVTVIESRAQSTPSKNEQKTESKAIYVPLITEGTVSSLSWTDIIPSEFYFDLADYSGVKEVRLQVYLLSVNNDEGSVRLYDQTNLRSVDFSDLHTKNSSFTRLESSPLVIWRGNNKYTIQLRSVNATQVQLKDAKLKIIF